MTAGGAKVRCDHPGCGKLVKQAGLKNHVRMAHDEDPRAFVTGRRRGPEVTPPAETQAGSGDPPPSSDGPWWNREIF